MYFQKLIPEKNNLSEVLVDRCPVKKFEVEICEHKICAIDSS